MGLPVPDQEVRAGHLLADGRSDQHRRHAHHRQPDGQPRRRSRDDDHHLRRRPGADLRGLVRERSTLSIHTIHAVRREAFYWAAILFTFALGTAAGDLVSEKLNLGYPVAALIFGGLIALVALAHFGLKVNAILAFWIAYILTRPFGASVGDYLSQARGDGGLGLGTVNAFTCCHHRA